MKDLLSLQESRWITENKIELKMLPVSKRKEAKDLRRDLVSKTVKCDASYRQGYAAAIEYVLSKKDDL